jgi:DNA-directed RNA polymerase specialized sigma24 family protein
MNSFQEKHGMDIPAIYLEALHALPLRQRQAFVLIRELGLTRKEAGHILKISENAVKFNMKMAVQKMKVLMEGRNRSRYSI